MQIHVKQHNLKKKIKKKCGKTKQFHWNNSQIMDTREEQNG